MNELPSRSSTPLVPPLYQSSVYTLPDLDALDRIMNAEEHGFIYARDGHPNAAELAAELCSVEGGKWGLVCGSGMASLSVAILGLVKSGDRIVASNRLYGRTNALLRQELKRFGVETTFVDCNDLDEVKKSLEIPTALVLVETISNPLLRVVDIPELARICHQQNTKLIVDNTFATPLLFRPLAEGADIVMESLTKMISGHADVTLGFIAGIDENLFPTMSQICSIWGFSSNPFDCWLTHRGLATLELRMKAATTNACHVSNWLQQHSSISRVIYPGLSNHPDTTLSQRLLPQGCGNMLCFEIKGDHRESVNRFMRNAKGIPFSPSLGNTSTTCSHPWTTSHRYESPKEKTRQGITEGLIRLSVGIEPGNRIIENLDSGLRVGV
jgi:cystathionine beta-lyase/cystathionine gamma-synthase